MTIRPERQVRYAYQLDYIIVTWHRGCVPSVEGAYYEGAKAIHALIEYYSFDKLAEQALVEMHTALRNLMQHFYNPWRLSSKASQEIEC